MQIQLLVNKCAFTPAKKHEKRSSYHQKWNSHKLDRVHLMKKLELDLYQNTTKAYSALINSY